VYESLFEQNKGLLITLAQHYARACELDRAVSEEDLIQAGYLALVHAKQTYDPSGGRSWVGWAAWYIRREYENALGLLNGTRSQAHSGADTLDRAVNADDGVSATLGELLPDDSLPDADAGLLLDDLRRDVRAAVNSLEDGDERRAVQLCQLEARDSRDAAQIMGMSPRQVRRLNHRAREHLFRDSRLRRLIDLDDRTRFHAHKGVAAFNRDWTSVTEGAALWRISEREKREGK
jgi:RNA polymerase sigma factor (sigma-70 family)